MTTNEQQRLRLHQSLERQIGEEMAGVLMSSLPPFDWNQVATKDDLKAFATRDEISVQFANLNTETHKAVRNHTLAMTGIMITCMTILAKF